LCDDCSMTTTDLQYGLTCNRNTPDGGKVCSADSDCSSPGGRCLIAPGQSRPSFCQCNPGYGCSDCSQHILALANRSVSCA
jgi:hypothetical protein